MKRKEKNMILIAIGLFAYYPIRYAIQLIFNI